MIVAIDNISPGISTTANGIGGMRKYLQELVSSLPNAIQNSSFKVFTPDWGEMFSLGEQGNVERVIAHGVPRQRVMRALYEQTILPKMAKQHRVDVWLGTCNALPLKIGCGKILIVQSLQCFNQPEVFSKARRSYLQWIIPRSIRSADAIIVFSDFSKKEVVQRFGITEDRIHVVYHGIASAVRKGAQTTGDDWGELAKHLPDRRPYVLSLSALYDYKNVPRLIKAFAMARKDFMDHRLVIAGGDGPRLGRADLDALASDLGVSDSVVTLGYVPQAIVPALYRQAKAFAMPSLDETFGHPIVEAMLFGCPVLTSKVSCLPEICGAAGVLVDPLSIESVASGLRDILTDSSLRQRLIASGHERAGQFTTEQMIRSLSSVINKFSPLSN